MNKTEKGEKYRCSALNEDGKQCRGTGAFDWEYFGHHQIYPGFVKDIPTWVRAYFCKRHNRALKQTL